MTDEIIDDKKPNDPPPAANQELEKRLKELEDKTAQLESEKKGIYADLKKEEARRREAEERLSFKEKKIRESKEEEDELLSDLEDDEYLTGKQLKSFHKKLLDRGKQREIGLMKVQADERVANDEARMQDLCELNPDKYPVAWADAVEAWKELCEEDPSLWQQYDFEKFRPGGHPAKLIYKIVLRDHDKFQDLTKKKTREELLDEMEKQDASKKKLKGGGGSGKKSLEDMSDEEISNLSDEELDKLAGKR